MKSELAGRVATAFALTSLLAVLVTVGILVAPAVRLRLGLKPAQHLTYPVGAKVDAPASAYQARPYTLLVFARHDCAVCQREKPWLSLLVKRIEQPGTASAVMLTSTANPEDQLHYAAELGIDRERVFALAPGSSKVQLVPTAVLVDQSGTVLYSQEGAPRGAEADVVAAMVAVVQRR